MAVLLCFALVLAFAGIGSSEEQNTRQSKPEMKKELQMMSGILDVYLKQNFPNPYGFVEKTKAMHLSGYGAVFSIQLGVFNETGTTDLSDIVSNTMEVSRQLESIRRNLSDSSAPSGLLRSRAGSFPKVKQKARRTDADIKKELVDKLTTFMVDYGATLKQLGTEDWFAIAAYPSGSLFTNEGDVKLIVKVKKKHLLEHQKGQLSLAHLKKKIEVIE